MRAAALHADPVCRASSDGRGNPEKQLQSIAWRMHLRLGDNGSSWQAARRYILRHTFPLCVLLLAACTSNPPTTFDLDPSLPFALARVSRGQLAVYEPTATLPLESQRVVVRTEAGTIAYLHGAQWTADLPSLVQDRLIGGFEAAHVLRAVGRPGLLADRNLHTDIQHFEVDVSRKKAIVEIYARLVAGDGRVVADKLFSATAPTANDHAATITKALSQAFAQVVHDIVIWAAPRV